MLWHFFPSPFRHWDGSSSTCKEKFYDSKFRLCHGWQWGPPCAQRGLRTPSTSLPAVVPPSPQHSHLLLSSDRAKPYRLNANAPAPRFVNHSGPPKRKKAVSIVNTSAHGCSPAARPGTHLRGTRADTPSLLYPLQPTRQRRAAALEARRGAPNPRTPNPRAGAAGTGAHLWGPAGPADPPSRGRSPAPSSSAGGSAPRRAAAAAGRGVRAAGRALPMGNAAGRGGAGRAVSRRYRRSVRRYQRQLSEGRAAWSSLRRGKPSLRGSRALLCPVPSRPALRSGLATSWEQTSLGLFQLCSAASSSARHSFCRTSP